MLAMLLVARKGTVDDDFDPFFFFIESTNLWILLVLLTMFLYYFAKIFNGRKFVLSSVIM